MARVTVPDPVPPLIAEASDPTTPPERLAALFPLVMKHNQHDLAQEFVNALLGNPNLPIHMLRNALLAPPIHPFSVAAWHNPTVTMLLLMEPLPEYAVAACRLLHWAHGGRTLPDDVRDQPGPLSARVAMIAHESLPAGRAPAPPSAQAPAASSPPVDEAHTLARLMARLFRLPWPERTAHSMSRSR